MNQELRETVSHGTGEYPFALYRISSPSHPITTPPHWHEELEIIWVQSGVLYLTIAGAHHTGRAGDLFIINAREIHGMFFNRADTGYVTILFPMTSLAFLSIDGSSRHFLIPLQERKLGFVHSLTGTPVYEAVLSDIRKLILLNQEQSQAYQLGTKACLMNILYLLFSAGLTVNAPNPPEDAALYREILSYLQENFTGELSLPAAAARFHMSEKYFSRFFRKNFRLTFVDYINHLRVEQAAELLVRSRLSMTEIALQSGFSSSSYFNKRFKALMGVTPSAYRTRFQSPEPR